MNIIKPFEIAFQYKRQKNWQFIYVAVDIHGTIFKPCFEKAETFEYYPYAKNVLRLMTERDDIKLILWSSSSKDKLENYLKHFEEDEINFDFVNLNPEGIDTNIGCFKEKFYCNVGLDDHFGFDPETDWWEIFQYLSSFDQCNYCGEYYHSYDSPMLRNDLWNQICDGNTMAHICLDCMEKKIGRKILKNDLIDSEIGKDVPWNEKFLGKFSTTK